MIFIKNKYLRPQAYFYVLIGLTKRLLLRKEMRWFSGKIGLEIGGPSRAFSGGGVLPAYNIAERIDGINYSQVTVWNKADNEEYLSKGKKQLGKLYILDATLIKEKKIFKNQKYDFVLSSNNLEHIANPLKALEQWIELLNIGGRLVLIVPAKEFTFDHKREYTEFSHIHKDYEINVLEDDMTHYEEIMEKHDLRMDPAAGSLEKFVQRSRDNYRNRCFYQHVYNWKLLEDIAGFFQLRIVKKIDLRNEYFIIYEKG